MPISSAFFSLIPFIAESFSGVYSKISKVSMPKVSTMRFAVIGPTPRISPLPKYFSKPAIVFG